MAFNSEPPLLGMTPLLSSREYDQISVRYGLPSFLSETRCEEDSRRPSSAYKHQQGGCTTLHASLAQRLSTVWEEFTESNTVRGSFFTQPATQQGRDSDEVLPGPGGPDPRLEGCKASWIKGQLRPAGGLARPCGDSLMEQGETKPASRGWGG